MNVLYNVFYKCIESKKKKKNGDENNNKNEKQKHE